MAKVSEAIHDEKGQLGYEGSMPGDQKSSEVITRDSSQSSNWVRIYRPKSKEAAEIIGESAKQCAANNFIGYSQPGRLSLYRAWATIRDHNIMLISEPVECDCSSMVAVCVNNAGIKIIPNMTTAIEDAVLMSTGAFDRLAYSETYRLQKGDILWRSGHTGICSESDPTGPSRQPKWVGRVNRNNVKVYTKPSAYKKNILQSHPLAGKGNLVNVCDEGKGTIYEFWHVQIGTSFGWIKKNRIDKV